MPSGKKRHKVATHKRKARGELTATRKNSVWKCAKNMSKVH